MVLRFYESERVIKLVCHFVITLTPTLTVQGEKKRVLLFTQLLCWNWRQGTDIKRVKLTNKNVVKYT